MPDTKLTVGTGVQTRFDTITCNELVVEGRVDLSDALFAEKVFVSGTGSLATGRISVASIEVSPGGFLQGLIEKYVPREAPDEILPKVETETEAEAA